MDSITKIIPHVLRSFRSLDRGESFFSTLYKNCIQSELRDVYHQIEQYHHCQTYTGQCARCIVLAGGCTDCMKMTYRFVRDCSIIIENIDDEYFSETMTEEEWKLYWNSKGR